MSEELPPPPAPPKRKRRRKANPKIRVAFRWSSQLRDEILEIVAYELAWWTQLRAPKPVVQVTAVIERLLKDAVADYWRKMEHVPGAPNPPNPERFKRNRKPDVHKKTT